MKKVLLVLLMTGLIVAGVAAASWEANTDIWNAGDSTANVTVGSKTIAGKTYPNVTTVKGKVTTKYQYGYAGIQLFDEAYRGAKGVKISVTGDGKTYDLRLNTSDRPDYCFHMFALKTTPGKVTTYEIPYSKFTQYTWGKPVALDTENIDGISIQTVGQPIPSYEFSVVSVEAL